MLAASGCLRRPRKKLHRNCYANSGMTLSENEREWAVHIKRGFSPRVEIFAMFVRFLFCLATTALVGALDTPLSKTGTLEDQTVSSADFLVRMPFATQTV